METARKNCAPDGTKWQRLCHPFSHFTLANPLDYHSRKGPFIKDVINQGGGGVCQKMILLNKLFSKNDDEGGWGVKNLKKLMKSFMNGP